MALRCVYKCVPRIINSSLARSTCVPQRNKSDLSGGLIGPPSLYTDVEISKDPEEWRFVERLLPPKFVPTPEEKTTYPSGWVAPKDSATKLPYYIERTRNHMPPVFLEIRLRGQTRWIKIKNIRGDIWALHEDLCAFLKKHLKEEVFATQVIELNGVIKVKGDKHALVSKWFEEKGF